MTLNLEWKHRVDRWREELPRHFYHPLGSVDLEGFATTEQLTAEEALDRTGDFRPMPPGTAWGAKWEYGWVRGRVALPEKAKGRRIALRVDAGGESLVYVDGRIAGARDQFHHEITLAMEGIPGTTYDVLVEAYAGNGPRVCHVGPTPLDRETVPEPPPTQTTVGESSFGIWEEDVYQLWADVETLYSLRECLDPDSLRLAEIDQGLRDFSLIADFELPREEMLATVDAARERLAPLLACTNGSTAPRMFAFGHAHIDVAWLWPLAETERKSARTFASQLALMEEYPEYHFLQSQPHLYRMVQERYPDLYERVKAAVATGQFVAEGSAWVEPDTNVSGGEALVRQLIHGRRFYRDELGVDCELLWLPDVFGYSAALPQICRGCSIKYLSTQKIFWAYHGGDPFPHNTFVWEGIDGSELLVHLHNDYNAQTRPADLIHRWRERVQKDGIATRLFPFGWGDGGGGPTRNHLEFLRREKDLEGVPRTEITSPLDFFHDQEARGWPEVRYVGELYYQEHRGTYTSQARTKRGNRQSELALREAELWACAARALSGYQVPRDALDRAWKRVLLNQFHDILPGSSIHRVYEEVEADYEQVLHTAHQVSTEAAAGLADDDAGALTVFNSLSWERTSLVALPEGLDGAADEAGEPLPAKVIDGRTCVEVPLPPCGWTTIQAAGPAAPDNQLQAAAGLLENDLLRIEMDERGGITSILDKEANREWAAGVCNEFVMFKDVPTWFDAWDIDSMYEMTPVPLEEPARVEVVAEGPLVASLRVSRRLNDSTLVQEISLRRNSRRVDFATIVDWQERHKLLKVAFPVTVHADEALHEIQFGHVRRPTHRSRPFDADRFEVSNHRWTALVEEGRGCAVLNDCKYGVSVLGNRISLTLLKSALAPDPTVDRGGQEFAYAFTSWNGSLHESDVVRQGYDLNCPVGLYPGAAGERSLFSLDAANVIVETVKPAEDGSDDVVVRLYEAKRTATRCTLTTSLPVAKAFQTDMLEANPQPLPYSEGKTELEFRPFEIKTVRFDMATE